MNFPVEPNEAELERFLKIAEKEYPADTIFESPMTLSRFRSNGKFEVSFVDRFIVMQPSGTRVFKHPNGWGKIISK